MAFSGRNPITRRDFFKTTAGALAAAGLAGCAEYDEPAQTAEAGLGGKAVSTKRK